MKDVRRNRIDEDCFEYDWREDDIIDEVIEEYLRLHRHLWNRLKEDFLWMVNKAYRRPKDRKTRMFARISMVR